MPTATQDFLTDTTRITSSQSENTAAEADTSGRPFQFRLRTLMAIVTASAAAFALCFTVRGGIILCVLLAQLLLATWATVARCRQLHVGSEPRSYSGGLSFSAALLVGIAPLLVVAVGWLGMTPQGDGWIWVLCFGELLATPVVIANALKRRFGNAALPLILLQTITGLIAGFVLYLSYALAGIC